MSLIMSSHNDAPNMQSYPSPNAVAADAGGPFYNSSNNNGSQPESRLPNPDEIQLAAQLSRGLAPQMGANNGPGIDARDAAAQAVANANHYAQQQEQAQAAQMEGSMDQSFDGSMAPRKRSKVSRACDECRRKKIRCDATTESGDEQCSSCKRVGTRCQFSRVPMKRGPSKGYIKELADRLNNLESSMQSGEIQYAPMQHDSTPPQGQEEYSPPPNGGPPRKRTYSTISNDFGASIQNHRPSVSWNPQEPQRNLPSGPYPATPDQSQIGYRPQYSPNGMAPQPVWANGPDAARRPSAAFDGYSHSNHNHIEIKLEWDDVLVDRYYTFIHPTFPLLSASKAKFNGRLNSCPSPLREACLEALYGAVRSISAVGTPARHEPQTSKRVMDLMAQFESENTRSVATNLVQLQIMLLMAIEADSYGPASSRAYGSSKSFWLSSAVGLAYSMKLHVTRTVENPTDPEADSDDLLGRRIWWTLVIIDRWHASSTASPLLIPETSVVVLPDDQVVLGENIYHFSRLSIILGHLATVIVAPGDPILPNSSSSSLISTLLTGELERFRESFPHSLPPAHLPLLHLAYFHVRLLMKRYAPSSTNEELLTPAMQIANMLSQNIGLVTPLSHHFAAVAATTLVELRDEKSEKEAESGLSLIVDYINSLARPPATPDVPKDWYSIITDILLRRDRTNSNAEGKASQNRARAERLSMSADAQEISRGSLQHLADLATASEEVLGERNEAIAVTAWDPTLLTKGGYLNVIAEGK